MFTEYSINGYWVILFLTLLVILHLAIEIFLHQRRLAKIKFRVHVNGTRGKSSITRLISAGLRAGEIKTVCKTTGTIARFISPDGVESPVYRIGRTNIIEQVKVVKRAQNYTPDALVIECMAVQPLLQSLCELKLVQSTHGVLCNARADHLDVMGPNEEDVAKALAGTMTVKGKFYTTERKHLDTFIAAAKDRGSDLYSIKDSEVEAVTDEELQKFSYSEYRENIALALKVCIDLGVSRDIALQGMQKATPDPGALTINTISYQGKKITLANGFAANDPDSTESLWHKVLQSCPEIDSVFAIVNCRSDRGDRSKQMAEAVNSWIQPSAYVVVGSGTDYFIKNTKAAMGTEIINAQGLQVEEVLELVTKKSDAKHILLIGICNIAEVGFALLNHFTKSQETK